MQERRILKSGGSVVPADKPHKFQYISRRFGIYLVAPQLRNNVIIKVCIKKCDVTDYLVSMILLILSSAFQIGTKPLKIGLCF